MPYLAHFGLREHPFFLSPTTDHFFPATQSLKVLQLLEQAIMRNGGLIKLVGPVRSGKTLTAHLLAQRLMQRADKPVNVALVTASQAHGSALIRDVCKAFGVAKADPDSKPLDLLGSYLVEQQAAETVNVLIIDDAQTMGLSGLETAQLLSELANDDGRLMHVVLVGQSSLDAMLAAKPMQSVRQAISFSFQTTPFSPDETRQFIARRIAASRDGNGGRDLFENKALDLIVEASAGIPGSIIILCDQSLRIAQQEGYRTVTRAQVQKALLDCPAMAPVSAPSPHKARAWIAGIGGALLGATAAGFILGSPTARDTLRTWIGFAEESAVAANAPAQTPTEQGGTASPSETAQTEGSETGGSQAEGTQAEATEAATAEAQPTPAPATPNPATPNPATPNTEANSREAASQSADEAPRSAPATTEATAASTAPESPEESQAAPAASASAPASAPASTPASTNAPAKPEAKPEATPREAPVRTARPAPTTPTAKPEAPKPVASTPAPAPAPARTPAPAPAPAPAPVVATPQVAAPVQSVPVSPAPSRSAPASSAPAPSTADDGQRKARLGPDGQWVWE